MNIQRVFLWIMIGSLSLAALLGIWAVLMPTFGTLQEHVLLTSVLVGLYSLPAFGCAVVFQRGRLQLVMMTGIVSAGLALGIWLAVIWFNISIWHAPWENLMRGGFTFTVLTIWATHFGLLHLLRLVHPGAKLTRVSTLTAAGALSGLLLLVIWAEIDEEFLWRIFAVLAILTSCGTLVTPILGVIEMLRARQSRESVPAQLVVDLTCPRCGSQEHIRAGVGRCDSCGLRIGIAIEEPRCTCGYLLHRLTGENCPECGRTIPEADRWHAARKAAGENPATTAIS